MKRRTLLKSIGISSFFGVGGIFAYSRSANARSFYYDGPVSDHFDGVRFFLPGQTRDKSQAELWKWRTSGGRKAWPAAFDSPYRDKPPAKVEGRALRVTLIGHASFLIQTGGRNILVDPVFSERVSPVGFIGPRRVNPPGIAFDDLPAIDTVLVTHNHYDHLDVESLRRIAARWPAQIIVPLGNDRILEAAGVAAPTTTLDWGQAHDLAPAMRVHLIPSKHWSARGLFDRRHALWGGFLLEAPGGPVHIMGDTGYHQPVFTEVKARFGAPRLSLIPIGAYEPRWFMRDQHMGPDEAVQAMLDCGAKSAIGFHWGTFQLTDEAIDEPPKELAAALKAKGVAAERFQAFLPGQVWQAAAS